MLLSAWPSLELRIVMDDEDPEGSTKAPPMQAPRSRLLLSCSESMLAVAERAYRRVETMPCPVGCLARGVSRVAAPVMGPLRRRLKPGCLSALSFADRQLVVAQDVAAVLLPRRAERVLGKVDGLVLLVESLPARFDGVADGLQALVAGVSKGVAAGLASTKQRCRGVDYVFRDIRCDEETGGVGKISEDVVAPEAARLEVVTVVDDGGGAGDGTKTIVVASAEITGYGETRCNEETGHPGTEDDRLRPASEEARHDDAAPGAHTQTQSMCPEAEKQEAGSDESGGDGDPTKPDVPVAEQYAQVVKQDSFSKEAVETRDAEIMEATDTEEVGSQQVASPEAGTSETAGEASGKESSRRDGDLLDLFDEAWQHKFA